MITQEKMEKALAYLAETDESSAIAHKSYEDSREAAKSIFSILMAAHTGTVAEREAAAYSDEKYKQAKDREFEALAQWNHMKNRRSTASIIIEVFRTQEASRRKGNIT